MFRLIKQLCLCPVLYLATLTGLNSCNTARYFATPDYFTLQPGLLILQNGEKIQGKISVNNLMANTVTIWPYPNGKKQFYTVKEVASCKLDIGVFGPMAVTREFSELSTRLTFMERLTPDSFSIGLYEAYERLTDPNRMGDVTLEGGVEYELKYYVHLPGEERAIARQISTPVLTERLSKGLDSLFRTCPALFHKIHSGDPAYDFHFSAQIPINDKVTLGRLSTKAKEDKVKIIIKVFTEYEECKRKQG